MLRLLLLIIIIVEQHLRAFLRPRPCIFNFLQLIVDHVLISKVLILMAHIVGEQLQGIDDRLWILCLLLGSNVGAVYETKPWFRETFNLSGGNVEADVHIVPHLKGLTDLRDSLRVTGLFRVPLSGVEYFVDYVAHDWVLGVCDSCDDCDLFEAMLCV